MRVRVKICGITTDQAAHAAAEAGADAAGFVFAVSPRRVDVRLAAKLMADLPAFVTRVAVFRNPARMDMVLVLEECPPDVIQAEPTPDVLKVARGGPRLLPVFHDGHRLTSELHEYLAGNRVCAEVLLESAGRGGCGEMPDWNRAAEVARKIPLVLAGGLTPANVRDAICRVRPAGVDVSSGVESSPGVKDPARIHDFVRAVREAEESVALEATL